MLKKCMKLIFFGLLIFILCINISVNASTIVIEEDGDEFEEYFFFSWDNGEKYSLKKDK